MTILKQIEKQNGFWVIEVPNYPTKKYRGTDQVLKRLEYLYDDIVNVNEGDDTDALCAVLDYELLFDRNETENDEELVISKDGNLRQIVQR